MSVFWSLSGRRFKVIYIDPPWRFRVRSEKGEGRGAVAHYKVMTLAQLKALPIAELAAKDCVLFMWVPDPHLAEGHELLKAWGFAYKTVGFYWVKLNKRPEHGADWFMGNGYWTRANPEQCWLAVRGNPKRQSTKVRRLIVEPRREHSRKPECVRERIEQLVAGPYIELFGRSPRPGWVSWGDETTRFVGLRRYHTRKKPSSGQLQPALPPSLY